MKILVVGNGGREHSIIKGITNSNSFLESNSEIFCSIGNPGINKLASPVNINSDDIYGLKDFAITNKIDFTIVGPELPLSMGIVDEFERNNLKIFGPTKNASRLETSKIFAKEFMSRHNIPTAKYKKFDESCLNDSYIFVNNISYPAVIKADGLAAGKGVFIAENKDEANKFIDDITKNRIFGNSGTSFIIEEYLKGFEVSVFAITDGEDFILLPTSQDHKKIGDGDTGKNTGGMGAYAPADDLLTDEIKSKIRQRIIQPTLEGMKKEGNAYKGCLYAGLMISEDGEPYVIEFNCRFGDPETQAVLPLIKSDFLQLLLYSAERKINKYVPVFHKKFSVCVIAASNGYPDAFEKGKIITGLDDIDSDSFVYHSGTGNEGEKVKSTGGRVVGLNYVSNISMKAAIDGAYKNLKKIKFENIYYRKDVGSKYYTYKKYL